MTIAWTAVSGATSYNVYWATSAGVTKASTKIASVTSPYTHTGRTNDTTYHYVVTAVNSGGESAESAEVSATPSANPPPANPTGVTATAGDTHVALSWSAVTGATSYNVYQATSPGVTPGTGTLVGSPSSTSFDDTGLTNGTAYYYVVTAENANGESSPSAQVSATPSSSPSIRALVLTAPSVPPFGFLEQVQVCTDGTCDTPISDATVTVNGTALTYDVSQQQYTGTVAIALGATVTLDVTIGAETFTGTGTQFTAYPTVTAPSSGATWQAASANTISWTGGAPTTGASYVVGVIDSDGAFVFPAGDQGPQELALGTTSAVVPAASLSAGSDQVLVGIGTTGIVDETSGGVAIPGTSAGSGMWLGALVFVPVTVQ